MKYTVTIEGMGCEMCVKKVNKALTELGAEVKSVEIGKAVCSFAGEPASLKQAIEDVGFDVIALDAE